MTEYLYTDGGCILANPSPHGGTWAWCLVKNNKRGHCNSGVYKPDFWMPSITNNQMELYAAVQGLKAVGEGWNGVLCTDSLITLTRLTIGERFNGIPQWLRMEALDLRRGRKWKTMLLGGHPTKKELLAGKRDDGTPVSKFNAWCDNQCQRLAKELCRATKAEKH